MGSFHTKGDKHIDSNLSRSEPISEMNVTPLVDVMLVLLIIFMVSAPLMQQGIQVDLPKTKSPSLDEQEKAVILVIKKSGSVEINGNEVTNESLQEKLQAIYAKRKERSFLFKRIMLSPMEPWPQ